MIEFDGTAALCLWSIDIEIGSSTYTVPPLPAYKWIIPIRQHRMLDIVPGMIDDENLDAAIYSGEIRTKECELAAYDAITRSSGMVWWCAYRIVHAVMETAHICGAMSLRMDPRTVPFSAWCSAAYSIIIEGGDDKHRRNIDTELMKAPAGIATEDLYDREQAAASFNALFAAQQADQQYQQEPL